MKVANIAPQAIKSPVRVTKTEYALWHAKPVMLGHIKRVGNYWYTEDGMRFVSSRNALEYLAKIREMIELETGLQKKYEEKLKGSKVAEAAQPQKKTAQPVKSPPKAASASKDVSKKKDFDRDAFDKFVLSLGYKKPDDDRTATQ